MRLLQQFDLNSNVIRQGSADESEGVNLSSLVEKLVRILVASGYVVIQSTSNFRGVPHSLTVVKDLGGSVVMNFSSKILEDFKSASAKLGIGKLFE